jgi:hypothetical protein
MPSEEDKQRLDAAIADAKRWFAASREGENTDLLAEAAAGGDPRRARLLPRIRALAADVLLPLVHHRRLLVDEIGALWLGEEVWRRGHLPRIFIAYRSRAIAPDAPQAELVLGFHPDGTVVLTWHMKSPLRHNATRLRRIDDLSPEAVAAEIDAFLAAAITGRIDQ